MTASQPEHWAVFITNQSNKQGFIDDLMRDSQDKLPGFSAIKGKKGALFSKLELDKFIEEEVRHDIKLLTSHTDQSLQSFSSGERKKALLNFLLDAKPQYLVLDNPFDNLDTGTQQYLRELLQKLSGKIHMIQLLSRQTDLLPFMDNYAVLTDGSLRWCEGVDQVAPLLSTGKWLIDGMIPEAMDKKEYNEEYLVQLSNVNVNYRDKAVLNKISWNIKPGEFWQLSGKNGSGKTTLLSMITGDNPKGYGQQIKLFGKKKGSGESIWEIKEKIGYFTPAMVDRFRGYHSLENMLISGLLDSIGLYIQPTEAQIRLAREWLALVGMQDISEQYFHEISLGQQRLIMCIRAMIKHPLLLILDEPTAGLDDTSAALVVDLVNKMASESDSTTIFVSHREEPGLEPIYTYQLDMSPTGSTGRVIVH